MPFAYAQGYGVTGRNRMALRANRNNEELLGFPGTLSLSVFSVVILPFHPSAFILSPCAFTANRKVRQSMLNSIFTIAKLIGY